MLMAETITSSPPVASTAEQAPREIALPGMHNDVMAAIRREFPHPKGIRVLDAGAGEGSLSAKLLAAGYSVAACDLYPQMFRVPGVECRQADAVGGLPYESASFDLVVSVEVIEHLDGHGTFFREANRVLKNGGRFLLTTPNMQSLKSRMRFLLTGYYYSFNPLNPSEHDPVRQHIAPFTIDRHRFLLGRCGFKLKSVSTDKYQKSSMLLMGLWPLVKLCSLLKFGSGEGVRLQNSPAALLGRTLFMVAEKQQDSFQTP